MDDLILALVLSLVLTELIECGLALSLNKSGKVLLLCSLVNLVTNPPTVLFSRLLGGGWPLIVELELLAVTIEGLLYGYSGLVKRPFLFSLTANALSFSLGLLINQLI